MSKRKLYLYSYKGYPYSVFSPLHSPIYHPMYLLLPPASPWISTYIALFPCYSLVMSGVHLLSIRTQKNYLATTLSTC